MSDEIDELESDHPRVVRQSEVREYWISTVLVLNGTGFESMVFDKTHTEVDCITTKYREWSLHNHDVLAHKANRGDYDE